MKRFADSLIRQKGIKPPAGYKTSISICRKFLSEHAPKKVDGETHGTREPKAVTPATDVIRDENCTGKRSRGEGQFDGHVHMDCLEQ